MNSFFRFTAIGLLLMVLVTVAADDIDFTTANTLAEIQERHRLLPVDDIWWTVNGDQMAWMNRNLHQLFPTVNVYRNGQVRELGVQLMPEIANFQLQTPEGSMPLSEFLDSEQSTVMGVVILHQGKIVFESYPRMQEYEQPIYWSVAKVMASTLIRLLEEEGQIDVSQRIEHYLPELSESSFADITVRNVLDMATGLDCSDQYENRQSCYYRYSAAIGDGFRDVTSANNPYDFLKTLQVGSHADQGQRRSYSGVNTFVLHWLVEKITGKPFQDVFSEEVWQHIGAESDASYLAYRYGIALSHGGFLSRLRDLARFGLLYTPSYQIVSDKQIISDEYLNLLFNDANPNLTNDRGEHSIYQWDMIDDSGYMFKGGWAGQGLLINPELDLVAVYAGYFKDDYSETQFAPLLFQLLNGIFSAEVNLECRALHPYW